MRRIYKFLRLPFQDQRLFLKSFCVLIAIRVGLSVLAFQTLRFLLASLTPSVSDFPQTNTTAMLKVSRTVEIISRYVPAMTCLTQALATHFLLARSGQASALRIGVAKSQEGKFQAHAWVESQGRIIIGKLPDLRRYSVLPPLEK
jgi:hypothetical protein